jgi:NADH:ubiquinone oxidoreductase subunit C
MKKIESSAATLVKDITQFYKPDRNHFLVINAVEVGEKIEVQWFFCDYAPPYDITTFFVLTDPETEIPSIRNIIESAWVAEAELVDLMNIKIENTKKGFVLEPDFESGPLRKKK